MKKDKVSAYRHGDLVLVPIKSLPEGLVKAKTNVIMQGSNGNDHSAKNADIYFKNINRFVFGYLHAKKGNYLQHVDHGNTVKGSILKKCSLPEGYYQLRHQFEDTHEGMKVVVD